MYLYTNEYIFVILPLAWLWRPSFLHTSNHPPLFNSCRPTPIVRFFSHLASMNTSSCQLLHRTSQKFSVFVALSDAHSLPLPLVIKLLHLLLSPYPFYPDSIKDIKSIMDFYRNKRPRRSSVSPNLKVAWQIRHYFRN